MSASMYVCVCVFTYMCVPQRTYTQLVECSFSFCRKDLSLMNHSSGTKDPNSLAQMISLCYFHAIFMLFSINLIMNVHRLLYSSSSGPQSTSTSQQHPQIPAVATSIIEIFMPKKDPKNRITKLIIVMISLFSYEYKMVRISGLFFFLF